MSASTVSQNSKRMLCVIHPLLLVICRLLSVAVAYIVFGVGYNRFVKRAKGREQFPNYSFWVTCGDRIAVSRKEGLM